VPYLGSEIEMLTLLIQKQGSLSCREGRASCSQLAAQWPELCGLVPCHASERGHTWHQHRQVEDHSFVATAQRADPSQLPLEAMMLTDSKDSHCHHVPDPVLDASPN
jgi:hypothetical protein